MTRYACPRLQRVTAQIDATPCISLAVPIAFWKCDTARG